MSGPDRGSEVVQFVLAVPLLLFMVFAIIQLGGMMLSANQLSADISRACRQLDVVGFESALNKETFIKEGILGKSTQLKESNLQVSAVQSKKDEQCLTGRLPDQGLVEQRTATTTLTYDVGYAVPSFLAVPGLSDGLLSRHVTCVYVDGRAIELALAAAL